MTGLFWGGIALMIIGYETPSAWAFFIGVGCLFFERYFR